MHTHRHKPVTRGRAARTAPTTPAHPAVAPADEPHDARSVSADDVRLAAYRKWESAGKPAGDGVVFWLEAEQELMHGK